MPLTRSHDWPYQLRLYLEAQRDEPFAWAKNDCCSSVCGWIKLATGIDVYADFAGKYSDEATAATAIQAVTGTGNTVEDAATYITARFTLAEIPPAFAQRGDVVLFDGQLGPMLGIVNLNGVHSVFPGDSGLRRIRTLSARKAWRI